MIFEAKPLSLNLYGSHISLPVKAQRHPMISSTCSLFLGSSKKSTSIDTSNQSWLAIACIRVKWKMLLSSSDSNPLESDFFRISVNIESLFRLANDFPLVRSSGSLFRSFILNVWSMMGLSIGVKVIPLILWMVIPCLLTLLL